nr:reverse transcriptase domain-containing protein [Tanacetum cinerariifolium]
MADQTMEELLQAPTKGMTSTLKYKDVPNDAIKLMLFSYSLEGDARIWYEKEPPNSILTWDDLVNKFVNQFFPPSKTTHLKNEISRFTQRFEETFGEAWERFKEMLRACGNLLSKTTREALKIIENKSKVHYSRGKLNVSRVNTNSKENSSKTDDRIDKLADQISNLVEIVNKKVITPSTAKAVETTCVISGGAHAYYDCIATDSNHSSVCAATGTYNQVSPPNRASNQIPPPGFALVQNNQNRRNLNNDMRSILGSFFQNQASTSGTLSSNTIPNPKGEMKVVTTRSGLAYEGPSIPTNSSPEKVVERETEEPMDNEHSNCQETDRSITRPKGMVEDVFVKVGKFHFPTDFVVVDFEANPRVPLILGRYFLRTGRALIDVYGEEITLQVYDESVTFNLNQTMRYSSTYDDNSMNRVDVIDIACEEFVQVVLDFKYNFKNSNRTLVSNPSFSEETKNEFCKEPIVKSFSPTLTPFGASDFFLEEIEDFLKDELIPTGIEDSFYDSEGDILYLEKLLNDDPS